MLASTASESPGKTRYESQLLLSSWTEQHLRTVRLVKDAYSSSYSEWNADEKWSSQEWKSDEVMEVRTGRLVKDRHSSSYSEWNDDEHWSSQEWKSDELMEVRTGRDLFMNNHPVCSHSTWTDLLLMTMIWTLTPSKNLTFR